MTRQRYQFPSSRPALDKFTYSSLYGMHYLLLHRTSQPLPCPISLSAFFRRLSVSLSTSPRMLSYWSYSNPLLILFQFAKSISPSQGTRRCFRRKSPRRLRNRCSVLQCWRLRLIDITYINYLPAIRACKLHTGCQSVSNMNMPAIPNLPCRRSLILRPRFATENFELITIHIIVKPTCISFEYASMCPHDGHCSDT